MRIADFGLRIDEAVHPRAKGRLWVSDSLRLAADCEEEESGIRGGLGRILGRWSLLWGRGLFRSSIGCR